MPTITADVYEAYQLICDRILSDADSPNVIIGPVLWRPSDPKDNHSKKVWYVLIGSHSKDGFRCAEIVVDTPELGDELRIDLGLTIPLWLKANNRKPGLIICVSSELAMAHACEHMWPSKRTTDLRKSVEAEQISP